MPSRKQRQRKLKSKRHEWETVWVDDDGTELDAPPEDVVAREREKKERTATKAQGAPAKKPSGRGSRREPQPPSWSRAFKRAGLLGIVVFFLFTFAAGSASNRYVAALVPAVIYTALFVPFTYLIDRFAYRRYQVKQGGPAATPRPAKKR